MGRNILCAIRATISGPVVLAAAISSSLLWPNQVSADLFDSLKKAAEEAIQKEVEDAVGTQSNQTVQSQPDMAVYQVQTYLTYLGYSVGQPDGFLNDRTSNAIREFQRDSGLSVNGAVTPELSASVQAAYMHYAQTGQRPGSDRVASSQSTSQPNAETMPSSAPRESSGQLPPTQIGTSSNSMTGSSGGLTPTSTPAASPSSGTTTSATGLNLPDRWSTIENGIVIPHPVSLDGRLLTARAIEHYAQWMGLADRRAANAALAEYLELVGIGIRPATIEEDPMRYVMFLTKSERDRYVCPTRPMTSQEIIARASGKVLDGCTTEIGELVWAGSNEFEIRRSRQQFIDDYRDRLIAAAPRLPIDFLDTSQSVVSEYDTTRKGFTLTGRAQSEYVGLVKGPHHRATPATSDEQRSGEPLAGGGIKLSTPDEHVFIGGPDPVFWPMDLASAEALINRLWAPTTTPSREAERRLYNRIQRTLTDAGPVTGAPKVIEARMVAISAAAYEDPQFEREIYRYNLGAETSTAGNEPETDSPVSSAATAATVELDPASGEPVSAPRTPGTASIADSISGGNGLTSLGVPLFRGVPVATYTTSGWDSEAGGRRNPTPLMRFFKRWQTADNPEMLRNTDHARLFLTDEVANQYMHRVPLYGKMRWTWKGSNEIEVARTEEKFVQDFAPRFKARSPRTPFDMWLIAEVRLGSYDFNRSGFTMSLPARLTYPASTSVVSLPGDFLRMDAGQAEKLANSLRPDRTVYLGIQIEVLSLANTRLKSMSLYSDKALTQTIQRYH